MMVRCGSYAAARPRDRQSETACGAEGRLRGSTRGKQRGASSSAITEKRHYQRWQVNSLLAPQKRICCSEICAVWAFENLHAQARVRRGREKHGHVTVETFSANAPPPRSNLPPTTASTRPHRPPAGLRQKLRVSMKSYHALRQRESHCSLRQQRASYCSVRRR